MSDASGSAADDYRAFAADYHWFFDDVALRLGTDVPGVRAALSRLASASRVLDAACGIGVDAAWLHRHGHSVVATDASAAMVDVARSRLAESGAHEVEVLHCAWDRLADALAPGTFDLVLCTGSAIAHAPDANAMIEALRTFRTMLRPGGVVVLDTHDWEIVLAGDGATVVEQREIERDGVRCVRQFSWQLPNHDGAPAIFEPAVTLHDGDHISHRSYPITLWPFTRTELRGRLESAGFQSIALDAMPGDDRYTAVARTVGIRY